MKALIFVLLLVKIVAARPDVFPQRMDSASAIITKQFYNFNELGEYSYQVETSDGLSRGENRTVHNPGTVQETAFVEGYYSYIGPSGQRYTVRYKSDENGFQPEGAHLPPSANVRNLPLLGVGEDALKSLQGGGLG